MLNVILKQISQSLKFCFHYVSAPLFNFEEMALNDSCSKAEIKSDFQKLKAGCEFYSFEFKLNKLPDQY